MLSVEDALQRIVAAVAPLPAETVTVAAALGRVLAEDLHARTSQPPSDVSAMDGYALRANDLQAQNIPARLTVIGESAAGRSFAGALGPGQAIRIFTGAALPEGADTVVIQEEATREGEEVLIEAVSELGAYVRPKGLDFREGELGLPAGQVMSARDIGLAAAMNRPWLQVHRRPRVSVIASGDELVMPGEPLGADQIISSNSLSLSAFLKASGAEPHLLGIAADDRGAIAHLIDAAKGSDLVLISGGASVGDHDLVRHVLDDKNVELGFWKIAMRPGKPMIFGRLHGTPLLGLPGNPVSAMVCATVFARAAINVMLGLPPQPAILPSARLLEPLPENDRRQDYLRASLSLAQDGTAEVTPFSRQDSSMLRTLCQSDCLIVRPPFAEALPAGARVSILPLFGGVIST